MAGPSLATRGSLLARLMELYKTPEVFLIRPPVPVPLFSLPQYQGPPIQAYTGHSLLSHLRPTPSSERQPVTTANMKVTLLAAGLVATVFAQDLSSIPECARSCLTDAISQDGQCQATDAACVCGRIDQLTTLATGCVLSACGQDVALNQVLPAVQTFCTNVGSSSGSSAASAPASATAASTSSEASAASSASASASASGSASSASATESHSSESASHTSMATSATGSASATGASATATSSVVTAGAAQYGSVSGLAAFVLGAIAIF
ncbi:hypothetical protein KVR01_000306 [Diaporthe batatas]|uniref:uncharacterized protein n=1 Tax=Diaporthe batatas TaxID=748121 RepID=UPI001D0378DD|nr:uncharacterized protein KVR01_000306 [Diaporthe batatas]KAG8169561.1 hypothetical protein KVR01_000306 [Diaporthe batatas]